MPHYVLDARTATPHFPGIGRYVTNLARGLAPLLAPDERLAVLHDPAHPLSLPQSEALQFLPVPASPFSLQQQWVIPRLLRQLARQDVPGTFRSAWHVDTVYHSAYYLMPYRPGALTVLTVYDLIPLLLPEHSTPRARLLFRWMMILALRATRVVLAISEATRRDFVAHFRLPPERIVTVPLASDFGSQESGVREQESRIPHRASRLTLPANYVLYLGSNKPHKNLVRLVEAWGIAKRKTKNEKRKLVIAGAWDERLPGAKQRAEELGLADHIIFLGPIAEADLPALYGGAELFVFPSLYEGFGLPVLEAMACGVPVICSNTSSLPEVVGDPSAGSGQAAALLVDPLSVDALAAAIGRVLGDATLREEMRQRGLQQAGRFTWAQTAQRTLAVYRSVVAESSQTY